MLSQPTLAASLLTVTQTTKQTLNTVKMLKHWVKVCYLAETYILFSGASNRLVLNIRMVLLGLKLMEAVTQFYNL